MSKAQGLPFNIIVLAIIAVLAVVVIVVFFTGGFGGIAGSLTEFSPEQCESTRASVRSQCQSDCTNAQATGGSTATFENTYCRRDIPAYQMQCFYANTDEDAEIEINYILSGKTYNPGATGKCDMILECTYRGYTANCEAPEAPTEEE